MNEKLLKKRKKRENGRKLSDVTEEESA